MSFGDGVSQSHNPSPKDKIQSRLQNFQNMQKNLQIYLVRSYISVCEKHSSKHSFVWCFTQNSCHSQNVGLSFLFTQRFTEHTECHADKFCVILCYLCAKNLVCGVSHRIHGTHRMPCGVNSVKFCAICVRKLLSVVFRTEFMSLTEGCFLFHTESTEYTELRGALLSHHAEWNNECSE